MTRVAVLLGGMSAEREVSLRTGAAVAEALRRRGADVVEIDAGRDLARRLEEARPDAVFIALHGRWGEDGAVQGLLEVMGIPYTGSGVLASALAMDKGRAKAVFESRGIPTPSYQVLGREEGVVAVELEPPVVVKPLCEGSTIGVTVVRESADLNAALEGAREYGTEVLVEKFIHGREVTLGVIDGEPFPLVEIAPEKGFYDYESKYTAGRTRYLCPAPLERELSEAATRAGCAAYRSVGCSGVARVDMMVDPDGQPWVLEVNTIPGMTATSLLPMGAAAAGLGFDDLVERMLAGAGLKT